MNEKTLLAVRQAGSEFSVWVFGLDSTPGLPVGIGRRVASGDEDVIRHERPRGDSRRGFNMEGGAHGQALELGPAAKKATEN
jgi:hypothetical protein